MNSTHPKGKESGLSISSRLSFVMNLCLLKTKCCTLLNNVLYLFICAILQSAKGAKVYNAAVAAAVDGQHTGKEGEEKVKMHTHSYCCLDYAQVPTANCSIRD